MEVEQTLYRFYNENDELIYVGITNTWYQRFHQHEKKSGWFSEAVKVTFEKYPDRESVELAESYIIKLEKPKYNKSQNPDYETASSHAQKIKQWVFENDIDLQHEPLVEYINLAREKFGWKRKSAKYAALIWFPAYSKAKNEIGFECRNCESYMHHTVYENGAKEAYAEWMRGDF